MPVADVDISYTLTGTVSDDNTYCVPDFGTMTFTAEYETQPLSDRSEFLETTVSKELNDQYWSVVDKTPDGDVVEEYLILSLREFTFFCDY